MIAVLSLGAAGLRLESTEDAEAAEALEKVERFVESELRRLAGPWGFIGPRTAYEAEVEATVDELGELE